MTLRETSQSKGAGRPSALSPANLGDERTAGNGARAGLEDIRRGLIAEISSSPLFDIVAESRLSPPLRKVITDIATIERRDLVAGLDSAIREQLATAPDISDISGRVANKTARLIELAEAEIAKAVDVFTRADRLPTCAMYASARTEPFSANPRTLEAVDRIVDHLVNRTRPPYSPEDTPGVALSNGGGDTGGMKFINEAALRALGRDRDSYSSRLILIPLKIQTDRERPFEVVHPAVWQTPPNDHLNTRTHSIMAVGNGHPLQESSCSITFFCGIGGFEETGGEISEMWSGREGGLVTNMTNGSRQIHIVSENLMFAPFKRFLKDQIKIGAYPENLGHRVHFWELSDKGHSAEEVATSIGKSFEEQRETPREASVRREEQRAIAADIASALWSSEKKPLISPRSFGPEGARHICETAADALYRKNVELLAVQRAAEQIRQNGIERQQAIEEAQQYVEGNCDSLLHLMGKLANRPVVSILGYSQDNTGTGRTDFLTDTLRETGREIIDYLVQSGISLALVSEGTNGVNHFVTEQFAEAQAKYKNSNSLLVCSRIIRDGMAGNTTGAVQTESLSAPLQSLMGRTLIRSMIGIPVANMVLGPTSPADLRIIIQGITDTQLSGITRTPTNGLQIAPESFIISGHYRGAPKGNFDGFDKQLKRMVERGSADPKDISNHPILTSKDPRATARHILDHVQTYKSLV